jgi:hypothetical protein
VKRNLRAQMVGFHHHCIIYSQRQYHEYYEYLKEADEFGAAAGTYPEERHELIANAAHRYQLLLDWMCERLHLNVSFLSRGKIWFNFYSDIASRFGLGTQAYTTETRKPLVGVSEISLQDIYLLQLILLHEMQHAIDFCNYSGLQMTLSERELRARISICEGLSSIQESHPKLYANAVQDLTYWYIITFLTAKISDSTKRDYYDLLNEDTRQFLSTAGRGVFFSPMVIRSLAKELQRDQISLSSASRYAIELINDQLSLRMISLSAEEAEMEPAEPDLLEKMMIEDDQLTQNTNSIQNLSKDDIAALSVDYRRDVLTTRNKLTDWQSYDETYQHLKEQALVAIERDTPAFGDVQQRLEKGASHLLEKSLFPQVQSMVPGATEPGKDNALKRLSLLNLPEAVQETIETNPDEINPDALPVRLEPLQNKHLQRHNIEDDQPTLEDRMSDLSEFLKERGGR